MAIDWTEPCAAAFHTQLQFALANACGLATTLVRAAHGEQLTEGGPSREWVEEYERLVARADVKCAAVRGNRPPASPITKGDVKRLFVVALRALADAVDEV